MTVQLKPYPEYKDSGVKWLGKVPSSWSVLPNRAVFEERITKGCVEEPLLSVTISRGVLRQSDFLGNSTKKDSSNEDKSNYKLVLEGDLPYNKMRMWQGAVGVSRYRGIVSPAYIILKPRAIAHSWYYHHLLRTPAYTRESHRYSYGICDDQLSLRFKDFKAMSSPVPPLPEQQQIVRFLRAAESRINRFIRNKRRLITLLKEQKQAIINQAVTRGIDPNVRLKPSGIDWLGDIPEHWEVAKLKRLANFNPSKSELRVDPREKHDVVFLPMEKISVDGHIDCSATKSISEVWNGFTYFRRGDVVIAKITPCFENGKGAYLQNLKTEFGFGTTELIILRPSKSISGAFLRFILSSDRFLVLGEQYMTGAAGQKRVSVDFVKEYPIALPCLVEQQKILEYLDDKLAEINNTISRTEREIELINEYRTRLVADVVTGKVDVRDIEVEDIDEETIIEDNGTEDDDEAFTEGVEGDDDA